MFGRANGRTNRAALEHEAGVSQHGLKRRNHVRRHCRLEWRHGDGLDMKLNGVGSELDPMIRYATTMA
jgi:hypothetical protein